MATLLDGKQLAQTMQAEIAAEVAAFVAGARRPPGSGGGAGRRQSGQPDLRPQQAQGLREGRHGQLAARAAREPRPETNCSTWSPSSTPTRGSTASSCSCRCRRTSTRRRSFDAVSPLKDVDGFGPESLGLLAAGRPRFLACTPLGVQQLLVRNGIAIDGRHVVIVGRSNIVGKPLALILMQKAPGANATVTVCHSRSRNLPDSRAGRHRRRRHRHRPDFLKADMVRPGAVVVDVGMNRLPDGKLVGDVDFEAVRRGGLGHHAGAGRRRADDHHHAAAQHPASRPAPDRGAGERDDIAAATPPRGWESTSSWCWAWSSPCTWAKRSSSRRSSPCSWRRSWLPRRCGCT